MPELTPEQVKQYNTFRATGISPERALMLATQEADNKYNPALEAGVDNILFGKGSFVNAVGRGIKEATTSGFKTVYEDTQNYGAGFALMKSPLSLLAGAGRGVGEVVGGALETVDDLTGEVASGFLAPVVEEAVNSDVGQYLMQQAVELDTKGRGIPSDILDSLNLVGIGAIAKSGAASTIRNRVVTAAKEVADGLTPPPGGASGGLASFFKNTVNDFRSNPNVQQITVNLGNIEKILAEKLDTSLLNQSLQEIKAALQSQNRVGFADDVATKLDDLTKNADAPLTPDEKATLEAYLRDIEGVLNDPAKAEGLEGFLRDGLNRVDNAAAGGTSFIEGLSDSFIDASMKTIDNVKNVPAAFASRAKQTIDRRIVRVATETPDVAKANILDLYKRGVVPGVKKKAKTVTNMKAIDAAVQRTVPDLAKKYEVNDLEDFANAIATEKKAIFAEIEKGLVDAGEQGRFVSTEPIVAQLDELLKTERASLSTPLRNAIEKAKKELVDEAEDGTITPKQITPSGAQDVIADLNAQLQSYFRGSTSGTNADVIVDTLVLNNLRQLTDDVVENLGAGSFKELKGRYADLKKMEDDVVHRAVFEAQKGNGLGSDVVDIMTAGDAVAGSMSPVFLAKGAAQFFTKEVIKSLSDKNELIRQMFLYGKNLP